MLFVKKPLSVHIYGFPIFTVIERKMFHRHISTSVVLKGFQTNFETSFDTCQFKKCVHFWKNNSMSYQRSKQTWAGWILQRDFLQIAKWSKGEFHPLPKQEIFADFPPFIFEWQGNSPWVNSNDCFEFAKVLNGYEYMKVIYLKCG